MSEWIKSFEDESSSNVTFIQSPVLLTSSTPKQPQLINPAWSLSPISVEVAGAYVIACQDTQTTPDSEWDDLSSYNTGLNSEIIKDSLCFHMRSKIKSPNLRRTSPAHLKQKVTTMEQMRSSESAVKSLWFNNSDRTPMTATSGEQHHENNACATSQQAIRVSGNTTGSQSGLDNKLPNKLVSLQRDITGTDCLNKNEYPEHFPSIQLINKVPSTSVNHCTPQKRSAERSPCRKKYKIDPKKKFIPVENVSDQVNEADSLCEVSDYIPEKKEQKIRRLMKFQVKWDPTADKFKADRPVTNSNGQLKHVVPELDNTENQKHEGRNQLQAKKKHGRILKRSENLQHETKKNSQVPKDRKSVPYNKCAQVDKQ